jgi:uncharacterized repeat protein (TIGR03803 family)
MRSDFSIKTLSAIGLCAITLSGCGGSSGSGTTNGASSGTAAPAVAMHANVTGLTAGTQLSLVNSAGEVLKVSTEVSKAFTQPVAATPGIEPRVMLASQPDDRVCSPANGTGRVFGTDTYNANFVCADTQHSYTIGGFIYGLEHHEHHHRLVISDNGDNPLTLDRDGEFRFPERVAHDGSYRVVVSEQPVGRVCSIANGAGSGVIRDVRSVDIICSEEALTLGGAVSGLVAGQVVSITDGTNATPLVLSADAKYAFPIGVARRGSYNVTIASQPTGGVCTVTNGRGTNVKANVTNVNVICTADQYTVGGTVTGLAVGEQVTLQNNGGNDLTVSDNQAFTFGTPVSYGSAYSVTIVTQPLNQTCAVQNGTGLDVQANVSNVTIDCKSAAQQFTMLYAFGTNGSGLDGRQPQAGLIQGADGNFYGTTNNGGPDAINSLFAIAGTVFRITPSGAESILYSFGFAGSTDGALPQGSLVLGNDGNFYGTTQNGGTFSLYGGTGTVFKLTPGGVETQLYSFPNNPNQDQGIYPVAALILGSDGNFYGTAAEGGQFCDSNGCSGVVFKMTPSGSLAALYAFGTNTGINGGANDGAGPSGALLQSLDGNFYGTTIVGGQFNNGTIFKITPAGIETVLYSFGAAGTTDGNSPRSNLIKDKAGNMYGTTFSGGVSNQGTVFRISPNGTVSILYSFTGSSNDGAQPNGGLLLASDGNLYGLTNIGGVNNSGTIYQLSTTGTEKVIHSFSGSDGSFPVGQLIQASDGNIYGVTSYGGLFGYGTVFRLTM